MIKTIGLFETKDTPEYSPISLEQFLNMDLAVGGGGKEIIKQQDKLKSIRDVVDFYSNPDNLKHIQTQLTPENWQYFNCMVAEFRHGVEDHHVRGWKNMTHEYYQSLPTMNDEEIKLFLETNPVDFCRTKDNLIKHSYHRACSMIGRLIKGKSYIPFYVKTSQLSSGIKNFGLLEKLNQLNLDKDEYCLTQSSILSLMGIRGNDDLDIIISSKLRNQSLNLPPWVEVFPANYSKFNYFGANGDNDLIQNYCIEIDGYKFLEPRFYFARKNQSNTERDISDWESIKEFFNKKSHLGYPFNFDFYKWGVNYVDIIQLKDLDLKTTTTIIDKYDRVVDGINHGRKVLYNSKSKEYIKIFHPEYCRLNNFRNAIHSGILNGLCPSLKQLIYDNDNLIGYICHEGEVCSQVPQEFFNTIVNNCIKHKKIYYDIVPQNIVKLSNGQYSLIDLESVYDLNELHLLPQHNATIKPSNLLQLIQK